MPEWRREKKAPLEIVREYFPEASDEELSLILWERTGWPSFFKKGVGLRTQLRQYHQVLKTGKPVCELCNSVATHLEIPHSQYCERCYQIFHLGNQDYERLERVRK